MLVRDRMSKNPLTISPDATVDQALQSMRSQGVRHLPVSDQGRIVGVVTNQDLIAAWFPSLLEDLTVKDVMNAEPVTISADATAYEAARIMHHHKLTGLLAIDEGALVGIITLADILGLFVEVMGLLQESSRFDVALNPLTHSLQDLNCIIHEQGAEVISVALIASGPEERIYSFRLGGNEPTQVVEALRRAGHQVFI